MAASQARSPQGQALFQTLLANKMKPPELTNVAPGGSLVRTKDGVTESVFTAPEKISPTEMQRDWVLAKQQGYQGNFMDYQREVKNMKEQRVRISVGGGTNFGGDEGGGVNNNGIPVGTYNKNGSYTSPKGRVFPASVVNEAQKEHDAGIALINKLNNLSEDDITNAFGSLTDYSTSRIGRMAAPTKTLDAQVKINNLQIGSVLNNLSQLKGASSDKEMAQMIKDFPGYEASPDIMKNWVERASKETNRFLKMREDRFAFDTEYAQEGRFKGKNPTPVKPIPVTPQSNAPMYIVNKTTGERQMSNDGGKTWSPVK
jgi:flagellar hook-associated protein FlgK